MVDVDGDGDLDAYLVQGTDLEPGGGAHDGVADSGDRLFRNELSETSALRFTDISAEAEYPLPQRRRRDVHGRQPDLAVGRAGPMRARFPPTIPCVAFAGLLAGCGRMPKER